MTSPTRILIVEDNPVDVRMICFALDEESSWNTQTTVADDGDRAIDYLLQANGDVDLVILDLNLPKRDGTEVLRTIRSTERLASVPVIILSSLPAIISERQVKALNLNADAYLHKPIGASEFMQLGQRIRECYKRVASSDGSPDGSGHAS